jgi:UDP-N-acetylglucosamine diphosphorylase/glucosamine-1-phosphate N-acetyltransferase
LNDTIPATKTCCYLFEDPAVANLEPLALTRPAFDLWCGAGPLFQRQRNWCGGAIAGGFVRSALAKLCRHSHPDWAINEALADRGGPVTLVNARWLPLGAAPFEGRSSEIGLVGDEVAYIHLVQSANSLNPDGLESQIAAWKQTLPSRPAGGRMMQYPWDLVESNADALREDAGLWRQLGLSSHAAPALVGPREDFLVHPSARVEPHVLVDTSGGPVLLDRDVRVQAFTRLEGPCYIGPQSQLFAARIRGGSIGPQCRIGGEIEASIVQGHSNKYHDGFLGHSYLGEWVNFGAGTHTSDLRTDYGTIAMPINGKTVPTGRMKVGAYIGDHTRTSIATLLNTGTVIGPFGLLIASGSLLPRLIPSFTRYGYGRIEERTDLGQMFAAAATAMSRRGQEWTDVHAGFYLALFDATATARRQVIRESEQRRLRRAMG